MDFNKMKIDVKNNILKIEALNRTHSLNGPEKHTRKHRLQKVLVVNRGEIAKRFFLALHEENIPSVAVVTEVDRGQSWYEFADEVVYIGEETNYTNIPVILAAVEFIGANAIYAGYGFLSENHSFVESIREYNKELIFMGPNPETMKVMGDKVSSRVLAKKNGVPLFESSEAFEDIDIEKIKSQIEKIGYPVIVKLSAGGGGKGMYPVFSEAELLKATESCCRIGKELYGDSRFYLEKYIQKPVHIEVQVFNGRAVGIRKCAVQRRNQKIIEESGNAFLEDHIALSFLSSAEKLAIVSGYGNCGAGTVEFLVDSTDNTFGFMEMNTRLQVEYGVTDQTLDIDLAKWQILYFDGRENEISGIDNIKFRVSEKKHAIECRIYAEEPENDYRPSPGVIKEIILPTFNGIRCDFGFTEGDKVLSMYDPMIGKLISFGADREEAIIRMERALQELYIRGIKTNVNQLQKIVRSDNFKSLDYTNNILNENRELCFDKEVQLEIDDSYFVFSAMGEYVKKINEVSARLMSVVEADGILSERVSHEVPFEYNVYSGTYSKNVSFVQMEQNQFYAYVDGKFFDQVGLISVNRNADDMIIEYKKKPRRVRIDRFVDYNSIRVKNENNKIVYFQMKIEAEGVAAEDNRGKVASPFQGTFVNFCSDDMKPGKEVKKGDPILILSAMKMETVVEAPVDGVIEYIIENGDIAKLQIAKTADGRILGKSIQEGELLVRISIQDKKSESAAGVKKTAGKGTTVFDKILNSENRDEIINAPEEYFDALVDMFHSMVRGYITRTDVIENVKHVMLGIDGKIWKSLITPERSNKICEIILHYTNIKKIFSPAINSDGFSFAEQCDLFIKNLSDGKYVPSPLFSELIEELMRSYSGKKINAVNIRRQDVLQMILFLKISYSFSLRHWPDIARQVQIVGSLDKKELITKKTLRRLYEHTIYQLDDTTAKFIKKIFSEFFAEEAIDVLSENLFNEKLISAKECVTDYTDSSVDALLKTAKKYDVEKMLNNSLSILKNSTFIKSSKNDIFNTCFQDKKLIMFGFVKNDKSETHCDSLVQLVKQMSDSAEQCGTGSGYYLDIYMDNFNFSLKEKTGSVSLNELRNQLSFSLKYFLQKSIVECILHFTEKNTGKERILRIVIRNNKLVIDFGYSTDPCFIYGSNADNSDDNKIFKMEKWPLEYWVNEIYDAGSAKEILVDGVDDNADGRQVGAKIYTGTIDGNEVCFYMKDYRILGGATGDLEGLKYGAACYFAYMKAVPLYVWNDSAGANIKEGVVSLNRGGQGFMMNSLLSHNVDGLTFKNYIENIYDEKLKSVLAKMNDKYSFNPNADHKSNTMVVAVGVGASAGLDVYGSSQATIQIILDSENSYRVLTGSNVIKSVLGEDISNYEIGGAGVLGKWTGIADLIAKDKLELITQIFDIQNLFYGSKKSESIRRIKTDAAQDKVSDIVLNESIICSNTDDGKYVQYKNAYYASNSLICGFSTIAGEKILIMGPRTDNGIRSDSSIIKAAEILKIAHKTETPQMIIIGSKWVNNCDMIYDAQNHIDLNHAVHNRKSERIVVVMNSEGFRETELISSADLLIYVDSKIASAREKTAAKRISSVIVNSIEEAFDYSAKYLKLMNNKLQKSKYSQKGIVNVPEDKSKPFDMVKEVINTICDDDTFFELNSSFNKPTGPNLITGLARLNGMTVGIIADQPMVKGGGADSLGTKKFRVFTQFLNRKNLPLLMLSNSSGFVPGTQQERYRIQAIGGDSLDENILGSIPVVSVVLNQNFGGRQIHAFSKSLRPGITYIAFKDATVAVMGATAAFDLLGVKKYNALISEGKQKEADEYQKKFLDDYNVKANAENDAASTKVIDWTFERNSNLRENIIKGFAESEEACKKVF
ncbi:MAG: hypothetical protein JW982_07955 [Spirochaetes bacterium]|nr:hypothetical protein [Spirochaetota bacterium]